MDKRKFTYEEVKNYIENNSNCILLSKEYINNSMLINLKCKCGNEFSTTFGRFKSLNKRQCDECSKINAINKKKLSYEHVNEFINNLGYELISKEYKNARSKIILKDKDGYYYTTTFANLQKGSVPYKFHTSNLYTIQNIKLWLKLNNKPFELVSDKFLGNHKKLQWRCLKDNCGEIFETIMESVLIGIGCGVCNGKQVGLSNCLTTKNPKLASEWHPTKNGDLTPYDFAVNSNKKAWWICEYGHEWEVKISIRNSKNTGCPYCSGRYATEENNLLAVNPELCKEWNYNKNKKKPEEYTPGSKQQVWWKCQECEHEWKTYICNRNKENGTSCPECSKSKGEKECKRVLISKGLIEINQDFYKKLSEIDKIKNIYFIPQKEFDGLVGIGGGLLSYDFYLPKYNLLIEYQGEQHERYIPGFHKNKKDFEKQLEHDRRKREYAQNNNINLLEIWYCDYDNIEEILKKLY